VATTKIYTLVDGSRLSLHDVFTHLAVAVTSGVDRQVAYGRRWPNAVDSQTGRLDKN